MRVFVNPARCVCCSSFFISVNFFPLFLGMVMCANEFKTKEEQILSEIKN